VGTPPPAQEATVPGDLIGQSILAAAAAPILAVHILIYVRHRKGRL
jgi:hypothetical protein